MVAGLAAGMAGTALGAPADLNPRGCIATGGLRDCATAGSGSLRGADALALSPDGRNLYASAYGSDSVFSFRRTGTGRLSFQGCVGNEGSGGCVDPPGDSLGGAGGIAVSPGGGDVYVASGLGRSVTRLSRSGSGALVFGSCTANAGAGGCLDPASDALVGASAIAVAPGGEDVYVTSFDGGAVSHLRRGADGSVPLSDCVADDGNFGCAATPGSLLEGAAAVVVDPAGRDVYVASLASGSLARFRRGPSGRLSYRGCWADEGANGCRKLPVDALSGATGMAMSSDGRSIVVASQVGLVSSFARSPKTGSVKFVSCVGRDGLGGCAKTERDSLGQATGIALSGRDVYVASQRSDSITHLALDGRGRLSFSSCIAAGRANGCSGGGSLASLDGAYAVATTGRGLYVAAPTPGSVTALELRSSR